MHDEREQANDEEAGDVRGAPLFEQEVDADAQIDQSDQRNIKAAPRVQVALLQVLQVGETILDHRVALIVAARHVVVEIHRIRKTGLVFDLIEVYLYVLGPEYIVTIDAILADAQEHVAALDAVERGRAVRFDMVG